MLALPITQLLTSLGPERLKERIQFQAKVRQDADALKGLFMRQGIDIRVALKLHDSLDFIKRRRSERLVEWTKDAVDQLSQLFKLALLVLRSVARCILVLPDIL